MELENSPLNEVEKDSLAVLFQRDPLSLTKEDVERICKELRSKRLQWAEDDKKAANKREAKKQLPQIDIDDILNTL